MRGSAIAASLALSLTAMCAVPVFAQPAPAPTRPAQPAPAQPAPATPTQPPATQAPPPVQPPAPFPAGAKVAYFNPQAVFQNSADGKAAVSRVNALIQKKQTENADKAKLLQGNQQKLQTSGSVMNEAARSQLEKEIEKMNRDIQFFQQDAQTEGQELQNQLQQEFQDKLNPVLEQVATEKGLHMVIDITNSGAVWANTGLDLTAEVIRRFDAASKTAPVKK